MSREIKSFKDVQDEIQMLRRDFIVALERIRIANIIQGVNTVQGTATNTYKDNEVNLINGLIQQFNKLINNIKGQ